MKKIKARVDDSEQNVIVIPIPNKSVSFKAAAIVVVAIHVGIAALFFVPSNNDNSKKASTIVQQTQEDKDFLANMNAKNEWPQTNSKPVIVAHSAKPASKPPAQPKQALVAAVPPQASKKVTSAPPSKPQAQKQLKQQQVAVSSPTPEKKKQTLPPRNPIDRTPQEELAAWKERANDQSTSQQARNFAQSRVDTLENAMKKGSATPQINSEPNEEQNESFSGRTYILASGDNLYSVSRKLNVPFSELIAHNNIRDVKDLYAGQCLKVP